MKVLVVFLHCNSIPYKNRQFKELCFSINSHTFQHCQILSAFLLFFYSNKVEKFSYSTHLCGKFWHIKIIRMLNQLVDINTFRRKMLIWEICILFTYNLRDISQRIQRSEHCFRKCLTRLRPAKNNISNHH